jgi:prevent-host-death family protein
MKTVQLRDAKATLSALVDAAEKGEPTVITRHGRPAAMLVPVDLGKRLHAPERRSLADFLLSIPTGFEVTRDQTPLRPVAL